MSSGPVGLDAREYAYGFFRYTIPDGVIHTISTRNRWLVTRIQMFAAAAFAGSLTLPGSSSILLEAGGCANLEPNGAHRGNVNVSGENAIVIIEYWFQASADGGTPLPVVTP